MPSESESRPGPDHGAPIGRRACQFGDGLFETLAVIDGQPCLWALHLARLRAGCARLGLPLPDPDALLARARRLAAGRPRAVLKLILAAGGAGRGYARDPAAAPDCWMDIGPWPRGEPWDGEGPLNMQHSPVTLAAQPLLGGLKHLNRLEQVLARRALDPGMQEAVMYDQHGRAVEGIAGNLLLLERGRYLTPPIEDCGVAGTVRALLLDAARRNGLPLRVAPLSRGRLLAGDGLFVSNALLGIRPVARLGARRYPVRQRPPALEAAHRACFTFSGEIQCND